MPPCSRRRPTRTWPRQGDTLEPVSESYYDREQERYTTYQLYGPFVWDSWRATGAIPALLHLTPQRLRVFADTPRALGRDDRADDCLAVALFGIVGDVAQRVNPFVVAAEQIPTNDMAPPLLISEERWRSTEEAIGDHRFLAVWHRERALEAEAAGELVRAEEHYEQAIAHAQQSPL